MKLRDIMEIDVPTVEPQQPVEIRLLREHDLPGVPVLPRFGDEIQAASRPIARHRDNRLPDTEHGRFAGIVTRLDVLEALHGE